MLLELLKSGINFERIEYAPLAHAFVVVNHGPLADEKDMSTWNDDATVMDPWYGICMTAAEIKINQDTDFFLHYPLLSTRDNRAITVHDDMSESFEKHLSLIEYYDETLQELAIETPSLTSQFA